MSTCHIVPILVHTPGDIFTWIPTTPNATQEHPSLDRGEGRD